MKCLIGKYLSGLLFSFFLVSNLSAESLCDSSCNLTISFPDGGYIQAIKPVTITFGESGFINSGTGTTAYPAGRELALAAGAKIEFSANGLFDLGAGGNIDYSDIVVYSNGVMELSANEGDSKVLIQDLTLLGGCSLNIGSDFEVVKTGMFHIFSGAVTASSDLSFTNHGSVSGLFVFNDGTLTLEETDYNVDGGVLIEADGQVTMTSSEVVIAESQVVTENPGSGDDATTGGDSGASAAASGAEAGGSGGATNIIALILFMNLLLATRWLSVAGRR